MQFISLPHNAKPEQYDTWLQAALHGSHTDPFCCTPSWQLAFHDAIGPKRRLLIAQAEGSVVAFAEGLISDDEIYITPLSLRGFLAAPCWVTQPRSFLPKQHTFLQKPTRRTFPKFWWGGWGRGSPMCSSY